MLFYSVCLTELPPASSGANLGSCSATVYLRCTFHTLGTGLTSFAYVCAALFAACVYCNTKNNKMHTIGMKKAKKPNLCALCVFVYNTPQTKGKRMKKKYLLKVATVAEVAKELGYKSKTSVERWGDEVPFRQAKMIECLQPKWAKAAMVLECIFEKEHQDQPVQN